MASSRRAIRTVRDLRKGDYIVMPVGLRAAAKGEEAPPKVLFEFLVQWGITQSGGQQFRAVSAGPNLTFVNIEYPVTEVDPKEEIKGTGDDQEIVDHRRFRVWFRGEDQNADPLEGFEGAETIADEGNERVGIEALGGPAEAKRALFGGGDSAEVPD